MRKFIFFPILALVLVACAGAPVSQRTAPSSSLRPSEVTTASEQTNLPAPQGDFFYSLPTYAIGEDVTLGGYSARLNDVELTDGHLNIDLSIANNSGRPVDMVWAVQLMHEGDGYVAPRQSPVVNSKVGEALLADRDDLGGTWSYDLIPARSLGDGSGPVDEIDLNEYRLLFVPFGWSGPVFIFRLTPSGQ